MREDEEFPPSPLFLSLLSKRPNDVWPPPPSPPSPPPLFISDNTNGRPDSKHLMDVAMLVSSLLRSGRSGRRGSVERACPSRPLSLCSNYDVSAPFTHLCTLLTSLAAVGGSVTFSSPGAGWTTDGQLEFYAAVARVPFGRSRIHSDHRDCLHTSWPMLFSRCTPQYHLRQCSLGLHPEMK